jgi:uncharacterized protein
MNKRKIVKDAEQFVFQELKGESSGHDWWHVHRVTQNAKFIAVEEEADLFVCELAALLHDIADEKLNESEQAGLEKVRHWLASAQVDPKTSDHIMEIISSLSFKGGDRPPMKTLEGQIVQDADRLDAIGAIGIARVFAYAGAKGHLIHDPNLSPRANMTAQEYRKGTSTAINHFYEKLLKLKDLMNTESGKRIAAQRHQVMKDYLKQFFYEWDGGLGNEC